MYSCNFMPKIKLKITNYYFFFFQKRFHRVLNILNNQFIFIIIIIVDIEYIHHLIDIFLGQLLLLIQLHLLELFGIVKLVYLLNVKHLHQVLYITYLLDNDMIPWILLVLVCTLVFQHQDILISLLSLHVVVKILLQRLLLQHLHIQLHVL